MDKFKIRLKKFADVYHSGGHVSGKILVCCSNDTIVKVLKVRLIGEVSIPWPRDALSWLLRQSDRYSKKIIFSEECRLVTEEGAPLIAAEKYRYRFKINLPENLPSSFQSMYGYIQYDLIATIANAQGLIGEVTRSINVIRPLDLNTIAAAVTPVEGLGFYTLWCPRHTSGFFRVKLLLPTGGAVSGEIIDATLDVANYCKTTIDVEELRLMAYVTCRSRLFKRTKTDDILARKNLYYHVSPGEIRSIQLKFKIPSLPPSNLGHCRIIDWEYFLKVKFRPSRLFQQTHFISVPIIIGTKHLKKKCIIQLDLNLNLTAAALIGFPLY